MHLCCIFFQRHFALNNELDLNYARDRAAFFSLSCVARFFPNRISYAFYRPMPCVEHSMPKSTTFCYLIVL